MQEMPTVERAVRWFACGDATLARCLRLGRVSASRCTGAGDGLAFL